MIEDYLHVLLLLVILPLYRAYHTRKRRLKEERDAVEQAWQSYNESYLRIVESRHEAAVSADKEGEAARNETVGRDG